MCQICVNEYVVCWHAPTLAGRHDFFADHTHTKFGATFSRRPKGWICTMTSLMKWWRQWQHTALICDCWIWVTAATSRTQSVQCMSATAAAVGARLTLRRIQVKAMFFWNDKDFALSSSRRWLLIEKIRLVTTILEHSKASPTRTYIHVRMIYAYTYSYVI